MPGAKSREGVGITVRLTAKQKEAIVATCKSLGITVTAAVAGLPTLLLLASRRTTDARASGAWKVWLAGTQDNSPGCW